MAMFDGVGALLTSTDRKT